ncbi:MAG: hypothetical protein ACK5V5_13970 [Cyclobacteriaceae bacterium]|jgi:hypothetical protein|nr:hypothetical protein [Flammeovirgaceae bacterium]
MKKILILIALIMLAIAVFAQPSKGSYPEVKVLSQKRDAFYFKVSRDLLGSEVEVIHDNGKVVAKERMKGRKMLIDFFDMESGVYVIRVTQGRYVKTFTHEKKLKLNAFEMLGHRVVHSDGAITYGMVSFFQPGVSQ